MLYTGTFAAAGSFPPVVPQGDSLQEAQLFLHSPPQKIPPIEPGGGVPLRYDRARPPPVGEGCQQRRGNKYQTGGYRYRCNILSALHKYFYCLPGTKKTSRGTWLVESSSVPCRWSPCSRTTGDIVKGGKVLIRLGLRSGPVIQQEGVSGRRFAKPCGSKRPDTPSSVRIFQPRLFGPMVRIHVVGGPDRSGHATPLPIHLPFTLFLAGGMVI